MYSPETGDTEDEMQTSVKQRISQFESENTKTSQDADEKSIPPSEISKTKAFELFESKGIVISMVNCYIVKHGNIVAKQSPKALLVCNIFLFGFY